ncbi:T9SS type A sorting domain-containing protein [Hymenobacter nivis]|uniref:T9SS C-terminal target domain-containing protein n=1 Tax=Hymenobacter nivis TaxID=1850093 RepID=A0A502GY22_9BACT|nr:T9SS type A sorting domain-containing protein [Hymenobacter nivis]TPG65926.1 T9SS C-terminal target domain-containing protein [Hymenobacter nivis]
MKKTYFSAAVALLATASLWGAPAGAQNLPTPKGKVSASLLELAKPAAAARGLAKTSASTGSPLQATNAVQVYNGYVVVQALANSPDAKQLLADLQAKGLRQGTAYGALVSGLFPVDKLATLESIPSLQLVRPVYKPSLNVGRTTSQGDRALRADAARSKYGLTGKGVKVGILSDSYDNLGGAAAGVASNDLPRGGVQVLEDLPSDGIDEGRGMAEIVHDVAPGAAIAFHTAFLGQADFAQGIEDLQAAGCQTIVDDVVYFDEPFFQNGIIAQAAQKVVAKGASYFSSAGNQAQQSYEATFRNSKTSVPGITGEAHSFAPGDVRQSITIAPGGSLSLALQWDDPAFSASGVRGAKSDMDLYLLYNGVPLFSSIDNNIGGDPFEFISVTNNGTAAVTVEAVIVKFDGPDPTRLKYINFGDRPTALEYDTQSSTLAGHANAPQVVAVGAAPYFNTPLFNANTPVPVVESFSSLGGTPLLFNDLGRRLGQPITSSKPEVTGPDGGNTTFFPPFPGQDFENDGFPNFFGTSAAAPHVAAVAALMLEVDDNLAPKAITKFLQQSAIDMDNPLTAGFDRGFDFKTGVGFVQADAAIRDLIKQKVIKKIKQLLVALYPNPSTGRVSFQVVADDQQAIVLTVLNQMGKEVFRSEGTSQLEATKDFSNLPKGLYITKVQTGTDVKTQSLLIQ